MRVDSRHVLFTVCAYLHLICFDYILITFCFGACCFLVTCHVRSLFSPVYFDLIKVLGLVSYFMCLCISCICFKAFDCLLSLLIVFLCFDLSVFVCLYGYVCMFTEGCECSVYTSVCSCGFLFVDFGIHV